MNSGGLIIAGVVGLVLFGLWHERHQQFQRYLPGEQNLRRASHGLVLAVAVVAALLGMYGLTGLRNYWPWLQRDPAAAWPGLLYLVPIVYGLIRFFFGARAARRNGPDGFLATRGLIKCAVGLAGAVLLYRTVHAVEGWAAALWLLLVLAAAWCVIVGATRFLLTVGFGGGNPRRAVTKQIRRNQTVLGRPPGWRPAARGLALAAVAVVIGGGAVWFLW